MPNTADSQLPDLLNERCFCIGLDRVALHAALESGFGVPGLARLAAEQWPHAFALRPVFMSLEDRARMQQAIHAIDHTVALPAFREQVLKDAPAAARHAQGETRGVFFGYDFHLHRGGVGLIEVNTNAGGAMLNAALARAQRACCAGIDDFFGPAPSAARFERDIIAMFRNEWRLSGRPGELRTIAIVDEAPQQQYLYPEFVLFKRLFERHGLRAVIADPRDLMLRDDRLWCGDLPIDLVYNRLTDFMLDEPANGAVRAAWLDDLAVVTPHPRAHALYADKRNLALLTDAERLIELGVPADVRAVLLHTIPKTELVTPANADRLWAGRKGLFFKPRAGFGSKAAYRGEKLTRRVWAEIVAGEYVAQALVAPGERMVDVDGGQSAMKFDVRNYAYAGQTQWVAARLYQGQTTNFRTAGGGFAAVYSTTQESGMDTACAC